jgi:hypothetical protein
MKYSDIITAARVDLRDPSAGNWSDATLLKLLNDGVQTAYKLTALLNPEMFWVKGTVELTVSGGNGPYKIAGTPAPNYLWIPRMENSQGKPVTLGSRETAVFQSSTGEPSEYWLEGFSSTGPDIYFNYAPAQDYTFSAWRIPVISRETDQNQDVPLPEVFFEPLNTWVTKYAGTLDEYATMDEDAKMNAMMPLVSVIVEARAPKMKVYVENLGF